MNLRDRLQIVEFEFDELVRVILGLDDLVERDLIAARIERARKAIREAIAACIDKEGYDC